MRNSNIELLRIVNICRRGHSRVVDQQNAARDTPKRSPIISLAHLE